MPDVLLVLLLLGLGLLLCWAVLRWDGERSFYAPPPFEPHDLHRARATMQEIDDLANAAVQDMVGVVSDHLQRRSGPHAKP